MKFRYKRFGQFLRPVIPIKLKNGIHTVNYEVLVDSGADVCIFDSGIGEILGLDVASGKPYKVGGIAGQSSMYYVHSIEMEIGGWPYKMVLRGFLWVTTDISKIALWAYYSSICLIPQRRTPIAIMNCF